MLSKVKSKLAKEGKRKLAKARQVVIGFEQQESLIYAPSAEIDQLSSADDNNLKQLHDSVQKLDQKNITVNRNKSSKYKYYLYKKSVLLIERSIKVIRRII